MSLRDNVALCLSFSPAGPKQPEGSLNRASSDSCPLFSPPLSLDETHQQGLENGFTVGLRQTARLGLPLPNSPPPCSSKRGGGRSQWAVPVEIKFGDPAVAGGRTGDSGVCRAELPCSGHAPPSPPPPSLAFETAAQSCSISQQICQVCSGGILQIPSDPELCSPKGATSG